MDMVVENNAKSLLQSEFVSNMKESKLLAISDIINETGEDIDVEILTRKLVREIRKSKRFALTNAIAGSGANADKLITTSRNLTNDKIFNQYTTQESGTLQAPELSLSGKFIKRAKNIGKTTRIDYIFLLTLSDIKTGKVLWDNEEIISKAIDKVGEYGSIAQPKYIDPKLKTLREECGNDMLESCKKMAGAKDVQGLMALCENDKVYACGVLGNMYHDGIVVSQNIVKARELHEEACSAGVLPSCMDLGVYVLHRAGCGARYRQGYTTHGEKL